MIILNFYILKGIFVNEANLEDEMKKIDIIYKAFWEV